MIYIAFGLLGILIGIKIGYYYEKQKAYILKPDIGEWIDIAKNPIPDDMNPGIEILISDGIEVQSTLFPKYNSSGKAIMGHYDCKRIVTHWRPLPQPPVVKK